MSNLDIFNLDAESLVTKVPASGAGKDLEFYKPYPEDGKDGVYKSLIRFVPNIFDAKKSKIHKYFIYLKDPISGDAFSADCPSTVGKKSILKDLYWKLKNSASAADQELSKSFSRKEDYYTLIQIVQDKNKPELEGKVMLFKFGKKLNDLIEAQIAPEYGESCNPYDLFNGREFSLSVRKVGEWNNYDLCSFVGSQSSIKINGVSMQKTNEDMAIIMDYLNNGPKNLTSFEYKDWSDELTEKVMTVIRNTVPEQRVINEILGGVASGHSTYTKPAPVAPAPNAQSQGSSNAYYNEAGDTKIAAASNPIPAYEAPKSAGTLEDLYANL